jgi:hypothetical protein
VVTSKRDCDSKAPPLVLFEPAIPAAVRSVSEALLRERAFLHGPIDQTFLQARVGKPRRGASSAGVGKRGGAAHGTAGTAREVAAVLDTVSRDYLEGDAAGAGPCGRHAAPRAISLHDGSIGPHMRPPYEENEP